MNFALTGKGRYIVIVASALSMIGSGSIIVHQLYPGDVSAAFSESHQTTLMRTPRGPGDAPVVPLGDLANPLFTKTGKAERADIAAAQLQPPIAKPAVTKPAAAEA